MKVPIDRITDSKENVYLLTKAMILRANMIEEFIDQETDIHELDVIPKAMHEILDKTIQYAVLEDE